MHINKKKTCTGNDLVPFDTKSLHEPVLTQICRRRWRGWEVLRIAMHLFALLPTLTLVPGFALGYDCQLVLASTERRHSERAIYLIALLPGLQFWEFDILWAQVEWRLEHRHGWLVKRQWAGSILGWVSRDEYQVLGSTSIPARLDTLAHWEPFSWLTSVGTTRNTVIRLGRRRIGLAVLILHAAGVGLTDRPAVISGRYNKYHSLQLQNYYAHFPPLQHTYIHASTTMRNWSWEWS